MPICTKEHVVEGANKKPILVDHYYVAGVCIVDPIHESTPEIFLRATYPYYHGRTYEQSKRMQETIVPNHTPLVPI
jgi:hypothetical protein